MFISKKITALIFVMLVSVESFEAKSVKLKEAYFAGGCFWGVEYYLEAQKGVASVESGFMGGFTKNPTYREVVYTKTGHIETVKVIYNPEKISFENLSKLFFEIHDFTQVGGQGPDIGERYESYVFYGTQEEKSTAQQLISTLSQKGYKVATKLQQSSRFYDADSYHQDYYQRHHKRPYCHSYKKIF